VSVVWERKTGAYFWQRTDGKERDLRCLAEAIEGGGAPSDRSINESTVPLLERRVAGKSLERAIGLAAVADGAATNEARALPPNFTIVSTALGIGT
jgi:hypothetical protein